MSARGRADALPEAGELLAVEAIDRTGLVVTSEGALVRAIRVTPPNPLILSASERAEIAAAFCRLVGRLRADQSLQFYVDARPVNLAQLLTAARREVEAVVGPPPVRGQVAQDPTAVSRWRLCAGMEESLRQHADEQAASQFAAYVVVPYVPPQRHARALPAGPRQAPAGSAGARPGCAPARRPREPRSH